MRTTPFHARTAALNSSLAWKEWAGFAAVRAYDTHSEREYHAIRHTAGLLDVSPLYKYDVTGRDAGRLLSRVWCRDVANLKVGRVVYSAMADERGRCLDDGTIARLTDDHFRVTTSEPWLHWWLRHARGLEVSVVDCTRSLAAVALQGPLARKILAPLIGWDLNRMRFFRVRRTLLSGKGPAGKIPLWVSRTGYTGDLGYELWMAPEHAEAVWDAIVEEGTPLGLEPVGLDALDVARIEAGFVLQGVDYVSARTAMTASRTSSPSEAGLGWTVDLDRGPFVGSDALRAEAKSGAKWALVGLEVDWAELERLYETYALPPHLAPVACRDPVPIYDFGGTRQIGQVTSTTWSPLLKRYLCLGQVLTPFSKEGSKLKVEHTPEFARRQLTARVVKTPFFDPPRKRSVPSTNPGGAA